MKSTEMSRNCPTFCIGVQHNFMLNNPVGNNPLVRSISYWQISLSVRIKESSDVHKLWLGHEWQILIVSNSFLINIYVYFSYIVISQLVHEKNSSTEFLRHSFSKSLKTLRCISLWTVWILVKKANYLNFQSFCFFV